MDVRSKTGTPVGSDFTSTGGTPIVIDVQAERAYAMNDSGVIFELSPLRSAAKPSDESVTSSTTLQDDNDLSFSIAADEQWVGEFVIFAGSLLSTTGAKTAITVPSGATMQASFQGGSLALNLQQTTTSGAEMTYSPAAFSPAANATIRVQFWVLNGSTPGTVQLQWAQHTSSGTALTFKKGSYLIASKV